MQLLVGLKANLVVMEVTKMDQTVPEYLAPYFVANLEGQSEQRRIQTVLFDTYGDISVNVSLDLGVRIRYSALVAAFLGAEKATRFLPVGLLNGFSSRFFRLVMIRLNASATLAQSLTDVQSNHLVLQKPFNVSSGRDVISTVDASEDPKLDAPY